MPALSYGLNIPKSKNALSNRPAPAKRKTIFDDDSGAEDGPDDDGDNAVSEEIETLGGLSTSASVPDSSKPKPSSNGAAPSKKPPPLMSLNPQTSLSAKHSAQKHTATAQSLDANIYDYDAVYDSLHAKPTSSTTNNGPTGPKYMANLLAAAEIRKRDQLRAKEKMLQKEREAEGEEFADKEKFVTAAYKAQQEEMRQLEEEELRKEEETAERRRRAGGGMTDMYRGMLERDEQRHAELLKAAEEDAKKKATTTATTDADEPQQQQSTNTKLDKEPEAASLRAKGVLLNDDGAIVDKRQLLTAGLNIVAKPKASPLPSSSSTSTSTSVPSSLSNSRAFGAKQAARERQSRMVAAQLEEAAKRAAEQDEEVEREARERAAKNRKTKEEVSGARERFLQRKREAEEAKKRKKKEEEGEGEGEGEGAGAEVAVA